MTSTDPKPNARFMSTFEDMAKKAVQNSDESVIQMTEDGYLLIVSHKEDGNFACQAMDNDDQGHFMERLHANTPFDPPLQAPYTDREVDTYERVHGVKIPHLLRHYLTHVSRESCCDSVRTIIDVDNPPSCKVFVSNDGSVEGSESSDRKDKGKECMTMQYTKRKLVVLNSEMAGLMVSLNDADQGEFKPLWMSVFFPIQGSGPADVPCKA